MLDPVLCALFVVLFTAACFFFQQRIRAPHGTTLPPGPKGLPIVGNLFQIPRERSWLTYADWSSTLGDVLYMEVLNNPLVILNSSKAATELLEKRSVNYADRPSLVMANELMGWDWDMAHMPYSDRWRQHRKMFHQYFRPQAVPAYQQIQVEATTTLLRQLLEAPDDFREHIRQHAASAILRVVYGYDVKSSHDHYVALAHEAIVGLSQTINVGSYLVDFLPSLRYIPSWFPGAAFKRQAKEWAIPAARLKDSPFDDFKRSFAAGTAVPCFVSQNLERLKNKISSDSLGEEIIKNCAGIAYLAGSDTTVSVILTWMLAMVLHPAIQARAQAELEKVVGTSRMPDFEDQPSLPYINAMLSETLRWNPVTPLAVPHKAIHDDVYDGFYIPAGSTVVGNVWAILHDEKIYPEPFEFKPERFLQEEGKDLPPDPIAIGAFGFGRRICPGRYFALNSAWIAIVSILSTFDITKARDTNGHEIEPAIDYTDGLVIHPKPFELSLKPRSQAVANPVPNPE
ncbi:cytochrome P450 [Collybia nuda]|uniref:Cytochrome P450 n=1 Tax=Collybia nuda TaxID=64659 RepID=A0A9P5Y5S7_9AGAR|nr:cytochrome P450 [Collybia nuda]